MKVTSSVRRLRALLAGIRDGSLQPQPEFQRRLVWTNADKLNFIDTVLNGLPFPEIYVAAGGVDTTTGVGVEQLVDGQQRITTLYHYFSGADEIRLNKAVPAYQALPEESKVAFLEYEVVVRDLGSMELDEIIKIFMRINATQYSLNPMEIEHAKYHGEFKKVAVGIADNPLFSEHRVFSPTQVRRMSDVGFALTLIITVMSSYFHRDSELSAYLERYNDDFEGKDEIQRELEQVFSFVEALNLANNSRAWGRSDLFTLLVETHRLLIRERGAEMEPAAVGRRLERFYDEVNKRQEEGPRNYKDEVLEAYYQAAVQATNDRGNRIRRGVVIYQVLNNVPPVDVVAKQQT